MPDLPFALRDAQLQAALGDAVDAEGKIARALDALGPVAGRDVTLLAADGTRRADDLRSAGARLTVVPGMDLSAQEAASADVVIAAWTDEPSPSGEADPVLREVERVLRPGGRLLLVRDYARDDVWPLLGDEAWRDARIAWSRPDGWFLRDRRFRVRVLHCWWSFESVDAARELLSRAFGATGEDVASRMRRPRLEYKVAIYHRSFPDAA